MKKLIQKNYLALVRVVLALSLLSWVSTSHAATSFDSLSFKPSSDQGPYFTIEGGQTLGKWGYAGGLWVEYSKNSLIAATPAGALIRNVITDQVSLQAGAALGLLDWLDVGLLVTFIPVQGFNGPTTGVADDGARMGDIRLSAKASLLKTQLEPFSLAVMPFFTLPTGDDTHFAGNGKVSGGMKVILETPVIKDRVKASVNLGFQARASAPVSTGTTLGNQFLYGLGLHTRLIGKLALVTEMNGWTTFSNFLSNGSRNLEFNGGFQYELPKGFMLSAGAGTGVLDGAGAPDYRLFSNIGYRRPQGIARIVGSQIVTDKIHFEYDRARIMNDSFPTLNDLVALLKRRNDIRHVSIEGHTDSHGSNSYNRSLSARRARAVRRYLVEQGIRSSRLSHVGKGESSPIATNQTRAGRARNRRVEFHIDLDRSSNARIVDMDRAPTFLE